MAVINRGILESKEPLMLTEQDLCRLQRASDWAREKTRKDEERFFMFSTEDAACEAAKELVEGLVNAKHVGGRNVEVVRRADPELKEALKRNLGKFDALYDGNSSEDRF